MISTIWILDQKQHSSTGLLASLLSNSGLAVSLYTNQAIPSWIKKNNCTLFINANWLTGLHDIHPFLEILKLQTNKYFIYNWNDSEQHNNLIKYFLPSASIIRITSSQIQWAKNSFSKSLAGQTSEFVSNSFVIQSIASPGKAHICLNDLPILVSTTLGISSVYILAGIDLNTLDDFLTSDRQSDFFIKSITPVLLFLKNELFENTWHTEIDMGCFILDDPPLKNSYGFADISKLLKTTNSAGSISLAFIPWYYTQSTKSIAQIFSENSPFLSLCIHGCDHTWGEFSCSSKDATILLNESLRRMELHTHRYKVHFDKILIFPQGIFSLESLKALAQSKIIAAINSTLFSYKDDLKIPSVDLASPVLVRFGFPLYKRRYPSDTIGQSLDRLIDRPAFFAEHHTFFRNGYTKLKELFENNRDIVWSNPETIITKYFQTRTNGEGQNFVRFFSSIFSYTNNLSTRIINFETNVIGESLINVSVNGNIVKFERLNEKICFSTVITSNTTIHVIIHKHQNSLTNIYTKTWKEKIYILQRRLLSEMRDNYICKFKLLQLAYNYIRKL